jgi:DNA-binding CsgD family transcriptional regulator
VPGALPAGDGGGAAAVVIAGAPGIGKTSVWRAVAGSWPAGVVVLRTTGVSGGQGAFANLADLLGPVAGRVLPGLPAPQAAALRTALGLAAAEGPLGEAVLERAVVAALGGLARDGVVVVAVDDEQWVDADTGRLLGVAVVRLAEMPVRWLVAVRSGHAGRGLARVLEHELGERVARVDLAGLEDGALSELVVARVPGRWSPGVLRQVVALAAGSPYAAVELARETVARGGHDGTAVYLPSSLAGSLRARLGRLGPQVLAVVQAAALAGAPTRGLLGVVAGGPVAGQVDEAVEAGVLEAVPPDPVLRFSHPLLRETAVAILSGPARRRLHRVIGAAVEDPDEAAWHLARGADEPDEALAGRVERAAEHAAARGAAARAAALAGSAADLTPDPGSPEGWRRRIYWLERLDAAGEFDQVRRLGEKWAVDVPVSLRGRLTAVRAGVEADAESSGRLYSEAFEDLAGRDLARAARAGTQMCLELGGIVGRLDEARSRAAAVIAQARAAGDPVLLREALAADGYLAALAGEAGAGDRLREAVRLPGFTGTPVPFYAPEAFLARWYLWRGELDPARDLLAAVIAVSERHGSDESAAYARIYLREVEWRAGHWDAAAAHAAAYARWSRETGNPLPGVSAYTVSLIEAGRGDIDRARERAATGVAQAEAERDGTSAALCRWVLGLLELSADDPAAALGWLEPVADIMQAGGIGEPGRYPFTPDLIEAWAVTGQLDRAASRLAWLQDAARLLDHPWARITSGRAAAALLLAQHDPAAAAAAVAAVVPEARQRRLPFELGRCLLVLGTAQRKARQRRDAAASLDEAIAVFAGLGAPRWQALAAAQRARLAPGPGRALTATEERIAGLVAAGQTNPEIAAALYISVKTVEANLTRIYRKLGLRGRVDLARRSPG